MQSVPLRSTAWAVAALALPVLLSSMATSIANVALPTLAEAFDASFAGVQWVVVAYLVATTALLVTVGRLGDLVGKRRTLLAGLALFMLASLLCAAAPTLWSLVAARVLQGIGAAIVMALAMAAVGETVGKDRTGRAMGLLGTMSALGTAMGPALGGVLIAGAGWRSIFLVNLPLGAIAGVLAWRYLPDDRVASGSRPPFDRAGALVLALTIATFALAATTGGRRIGAPQFALLALAAIGAVLFVAIERRASVPLLPADLLRDPRVRVGAASSALVSTVVMATLVVGPFHLAGALALDAARVGLVMSCGPIAAALLGLPAGRLADRIGAARMVVIGLGVMAAGTMLMALIAPHAGAGGYAATLVVMTGGYALFQAANTTAVMTAATPSRRGVTSGLLNLARSLGLVSGASLMGTIFVLALPAGSVATASPEFIAHGTRVVFGVATGLVAIALGLSAAAGRSLHSASVEERGPAGARVAASLLGDR